MSVPAAYLGVVLIWSTTPLAIQWSSAGWGFMFGLTGRMLLGTLVCVALLGMLRTGLPWHRSARLTYVIAGVSIYGAMMAVYWGAQFVASGLIAVLYGLNPLLTGIIAAFWLGEKFFTPGRLLGVMLGITGLVIIFAADLIIDSGATHGVLAILCSVFLHSFSSVWIKRADAALSGLAVTTGGLLLATPLFILTWWLLDGAWPAAINVQAGAAMIYLGVCGSALGFSLYYFLLNNLDANRVALITLITPGTALILGQLVNQEIISAEVWLGSGLVLAGLVLHLWGDALLGRWRA